MSVMDKTENSFQMSKEQEPYVIKRNGQRQKVDFNKITHRLQKLKIVVEKEFNRKLHVSTRRIAQTTIGQIYNGILTSELDEQAAEISSVITDHPDYQLFAGQILVTNLEANNRDCLSFQAYAEKAYNFSIKDEHVPLITLELKQIAEKYGHIIDRKMVMARNYYFDYFAVQTLLKGKYLLSAYRQRGKIEPFETPQHLFMRVALGLFGSDLESAFELYNEMSEHRCIMATPTLMYAGTPTGQLASCFLLAMKEDSIEGIYDTIKDCALISKMAGGIGVHIHNIRPEGSYIKGTNGVSNGIVPMLKVFNDTARYVDQGGGKRKGSFAIYLEVWHADLMEFLDLKLESGSDELRARDLFYALWICDLFMKRLKTAFERDVNEESKNPTLWSLMSPNDCPGLSDTYGEEFETLYLTYESKRNFVKQIPIKDIFHCLTRSMIETGGPYLLSKDAANRKSNQQNVGVIKSSNLCAEIIEYSDPQETACCNLASISLPAFVDTQTKTFRNEQLKQTTRILVKACNRVIDCNRYPIPTASRSNFRHRPIAIGIQGTAKAFIMMRIPYGSPRSCQLNRDISELMYFAALQESCAQAVKHGPYPSMHDNMGAPISRGIFQFEMWKEDFANTLNPDGWRPNANLALDWESLRRDIIQYGVRNSLLIAHMPTASTSSILQNPECFEPYYGFTFMRRTKNGEYVIFCRELVEDLIQVGLWEPAIHPTLNVTHIPMYDKIKQYEGNIQKIDEIPQELKDIYVTVFDVPQKVITIMARDRALFCCQSSSNNINMKNSDDMSKKILKYITFAWQLGLKTISYYFRTLPDLKILPIATVKPLNTCSSCSA